tara:strand:+ start:330 stop:587 length:258 start_codon:yes stop_codon:yes gene_type:complete
MTYYIKFPGIAFDPEVSACILGEVSLNKFWPQNGWHHLHWLIDNHANQTQKTPGFFESIIIYDNYGKVVDLEKTLDKIQKLHMPK